jgi:2-iminoacetate synthase
MTFADVIGAWPAERVRDLIEGATDADVSRAIRADEPTERDLAALLSAAADGRLEEIAQQAHRHTRAHFGRTIGLYVPLYVSNVCAADCAYCNYAVGSGSTEVRRTLSEGEIDAECRELASRGFRSILLLTGEAPRTASVAFIRRSVEIAAGHVPSVNVEVYALDAAGYAALVASGLDGVSLYQETYDPRTYATVHARGQKADYRYRLDAIQAAGQSGARKLSVGALLGLFDWRIDGFWTGLHARYLQRVCWRSAVSISFPRLRNVPRRFAIARAVCDRDLVRLMVALRVFFPQAGFNLSTREPAALRDALIPLGVTMMSAGSSTRPGGYARSAAGTVAQFEVSDERSPAEVAAAIRRVGYDPIWKDFDAAFLDPVRAPAAVARGGTT